ncbi:hypothetical protein GPO01_003165, partial [Salmonella enterica]|nr:hypothetical protein [Salmonella enterica]
LVYVINTLWHRELSAFSVYQITFYYLTGQALLNLKCILAANIINTNYIKQ